MQTFALDVPSVISPTIVHMDMATRWNAARQVLGLSHYKAGQLQVPCSSFEEVSEPRPTNLWASSGYFIVLALTGYGL